MRRPLRLCARTPSSARCAPIVALSRPAVDVVRPDGRRTMRSSLPIAAAQIMPWRRHQHGHDRLDQLAAAGDRQRDRRRRSAAIVLAESAADPGRRRDPVAGPGRLQHRRHAEDHRHRPRAGSSSKRRRARRCISSTSSRTAAAAGSGKPITSAPCPTSRSSSPTISSASREALLGRQFTDLLSVDTQSPDVVRGAQDARLPSVGALPLLRRRRSPGERAGRPLVAVGQSDLRRARPLPRLPRHRHRPHRAAPLRAGNLAPRPVRFADRPAQPRDDAPDARRSAAQRRPSPEGLRAVPDRSRSLQERQRYARPPDRRRAAAPGRRTAEVGDGQPWPGRPPRRRRIPGGAARHGRHRPARNRLPGR